MRHPKKLTVENMSDAFMDLVAERYPSSDKVRALAPQLGIEDSIDAQIIVFSVMRDTVREVAKNHIYNSLQHRDDVFNAIIEALEDLEDEKEELEERLALEEEEEEEEEEGVT